MESSWLLMNCITTWRVRGKLCITPSTADSSSAMVLVCDADITSGPWFWRRWWLIPGQNMSTLNTTQHCHDTTCLWHRGARLIINSITESVKTQTTLYTSTHTAVTVTTHWPSSWSSYFSTSNSLVRKVATVLEGKVKGLFKDFQGCVFHVSSPSLSSGAIRTAFKHLYYSCCILTKK